ncbi:MAG: cation-translocating P-type ATPase [Burkholderiales bacterium]
MPDESAYAGSCHRWKVAGMDCGSCALTIESALARLPGMRRVQVDFTTESLECEGTAPRAAIAQVLEKLGFRLVDGDMARDAAGRAPPAEPDLIRRLWAQRPLRVALSATAAAGLVTTIDAAAPGTLPAAAAPVVLTAAVIVATAPIGAKGLRALWHGRRVTIDLLMTIAAVGALTIGERWEALTVVVLFTIGEVLEGLSAERARASLRSLLALQPETATLLRPHAATHAAAAFADLGGTHGDEAPVRDPARSHGNASAAGPGCDHGAAPAHAHGHGHGDDHAHDVGRIPKAGPPQPTVREHFHAEIVAASAVRPQDRLLVRPGERVPVDGLIVEGESSLNEAAVTGESLPVRRGAGDAVLAGTINGEGALEIVATRVAGDSTIARIARLVEQAQAQRSPQERFIDRFARIYTPAVVALALLVVTVPVLAFGQPLLDSPDGSSGWLYRGLALLIVACPCALVISIPVTVVSALTRLAQLGVLVKGGAPLDRLADVRVVAFDKTGTLTQGRPAVTAVQGRDCRHAEAVAADCDDCTDVIALAASVELRSGHPIAHAIAQAANARGVMHRYAGAIGIHAIAGRGVVGEIGGARIAIGSDAMFASDTPPTEVPQSFAAALRASHRTVMLVARDSAIIGAIGVEDVVRDESAQALRELRGMSPPVATLMLTGDHRRVAEAVAAQLGGLGEVRAGLLPGQKLDAIDEARLRYGPVAMVGDGINDGPALARADVGLAMGGSGSAQAMEAADVVLMQDDLRRVPVALQLSRLTRRVVRQNVALSLGLKLAFLGLAVPGWATLWLAVAADVGATLLVTMNGLRLLRARG